MYCALRHLLVSACIVRGAIGSPSTRGAGDASSASRTAAGPAASTASSSSACAGRVQTTGSIASTASTAGTAICPSRPVNYITHPLARQCLRTDRTGRMSAYATAAAEHTPPPPHAAGGDASAVFSSPPRTLDASALPPPDDEGESPLDNANFLSFEEWKRQNLAKAGQSPDDVGTAPPAEPHRPRPIHNALDSMGEESEIDLDFSGFGAVPAAPPPEQSVAKADPAVSASAHLAPLRRSKDAGKTCKERTNYASFDCAATVLKSNKECTHSSSILIEHKDSYMLNICSVKNKFFIVELCDDIQIDTIVLANYEFFSSTFRHFKVSVSDRYPVKEEKWKVLGMFEARNTREMQAFLVENPIIWAKYLRIELLSHYGTEYYCPISLLRVHGTTMMEDYRHQEELARGEIEEPEALTSATDPEHSTDEAAATPSVPAVPPVRHGDHVSAQPEPAPQSPEKAEATTTTASAASNSDKAALAETAVTCSNGTLLPVPVGVHGPTNENVTCGTPDPSSQRATSPTARSSDSSPATSASANTSAPSAPDQPGSKDAVSGNPTQHPPMAQVGPSNTTVAASEGAKNATAPSNTPAANPTSTMAAKAQTAAATNSTRTASSPSSPPPPQPSTQESFFKSVTKRLLQLENNSTLSLQYIEEQSRILRDAFRKVEKRQLGTTTKFLAQLNDTVMVELHGFRQAYDQLWQSTVIELENQRETYQREMLALSSRLTMVADELVWQKRMGIAQSTLLLLCLALVLFGREGTRGGRDVPIMQHMMKKSREALRGGWDSQSPPHSPASPESRSPVALFRRKIWRSSPPAPTPGRDPHPHVRDSEPRRHHTGGGGHDGGGGGSTPSSSQERSRTALPVEPPPRAPPRRAGKPTSDWEDVTDRAESPESRASPEPARKGEGTARSPGKKRKKARNRPSPQHGAVSAAAGPHVRPKSPLAKSD